jgi:hypothetical protein
MGETDKTYKNIAECRARGLRILPPDVNESREDFTVGQPDADGKRPIRFGLGAVRGVGSKAIDGIISARAQGPFTSLADFCKRVQSQHANKRVIESLIKCGAFDFLGEPRRRLLDGVERTCQWAAPGTRVEELNQIGLFAPGSIRVTVSQPPPLPDVPEWDMKERLRAERDAHDPGLGACARQHVAAIDELSDAGIALLINARLLQPKSESVRSHYEITGGIEAQIVGTLDRNPNRARIRVAADRQVVLERILIAVVDKIDAGIDPQIANAPVIRNIRAPSRWIVPDEIVDTRRQRIVPGNARVSCVYESHPHDAFSERAGPRSTSRRIAVGLRRRAHRDHCVVAGQKERVAGTVREITHSLIGLSDVRFETERQCLVRLERLVANHALRRDRLNRSSLVCA